MPSSNCCIALVISSPTGFHWLESGHQRPPRTCSPRSPAPTSPVRTLDQDPVFAIDQLVEIAIRALSPAVNDTFTALTYIDWLADGLCSASERSLPDGAHRDGTGAIRVIELGPSYARMVNRAYDKIRQAGADMPAVAIRLMESLGKVLAYTVTHDQRRVLQRQAQMIWPASQRGIDEPANLLEIQRRYQPLAEATNPDEPEACTTPHWLIPEARAMDPTSPECDVPVTTTSIQPTT